MDKKKKKHGKLYLETTECVLSMKTIFICM